MLVSTSSDFKKIKGVNTVLKDAGLNKTALDNIITLTLVRHRRLIPRIDFRVETTIDRKLNNNQYDLMSEASNGDIYFLEKKTAKKNSKEIELGTINILIKDDLLKGKKLELI